MAGSASVVRPAGSPSTPMKTTDGRSSAGSRPSKPPLAHIDDVLYFDINLQRFIDGPIDKALNEADNLLNSALASINFGGRLDYALQDFLRAREIITRAIPKNKAFPGLRSENKSQLDRYSALLERMNNLLGKFDEIQDEIRADNARTGVQPTVRHSKASKYTSPTTIPTRIPTPGETGVASPDGNSISPPSGSSPSVHTLPPQIKPKPTNLQGQVLHNRSQSASAVTASLLERLSNLRQNKTLSPKQDSPIRMPPSVPSEPQSLPHEPPHPTSSTGSASSFPEMPKVPEAIYHPPRGTVSPLASAMPTTAAPRPVFTRTSSTSSLNGNRSSRPSLVDKRTTFGQSFVPPNPVSKKSGLSIPPGDTIAAEELFQLMKMSDDSFRILLVDIRSREEFDAGHIMSEATICIEREVLLRRDISASDIAEAICISPAHEQLLFEKRHDHDIIVFYDQDSERIVSTPQNPREQAVVAFFRALNIYDYSQRKAIVKLLCGGIKAWTMLYGPNTLESSSTAPSKTEPMSPSSATSSLLTPSRRMHLPRSIQDPEQAKRWESTMADDSAISPIRTTEELLRHFPAIPGAKESMTSSSSPSLMNHRSPYFTSVGSIPLPPTRPPPAFPRRTHSELGDAGESLYSATRPAVKSPPLGREGLRRLRPGLKNPGVYCFANSSLQAMFSTPGFSHEVMMGEWGPVPRKPGERMENPQLLIKSLSMIFKWLHQGDMKALETRTFMEYIREIHGKGPDGKHKPEPEVFGGCYQQDAQEFYSFVMDNIHDETNVRRDRPPPKGEKSYTPKDGSIIQNAMDYWNLYSRASASIVDKWFRGLEAFISTCHNPGCRQEIRLFQPCDIWILNLSGMGSQTDLESLLVNHQTSEHFPDLICETCKKPGRSRKAKFARLPDRLIFCLNRFHSNSSSGFSSPFSSNSKIHSKVRFPIRDLDLTRFCAEPDPDMATTEDRHFAGRMKYDCYAVTVHVGTGINGGHYYAYVQDDSSPDPTDWFRCNDENVDRVKIGAGPGVSGDMTEQMYQSGNASAYMIFYRRQGT